ncbi:hypothetical protein OEZ71_14970 [Defluviimonas sp. WL0050]|uniref:Lipoprotein n=2 Tax=Albidovulum litorale TaxID=2984134 RepID=A0ABT2ZR09_9RHOB|nr:hypothetical protein [Defluviimonas sp. WL0050]
MIAKKGFFMGRFWFFALLPLLAACTPTTPTLHFASENAVALRYHAYDEVPTLTAQALDEAARHCAKYGKFANYKGGNAVNALSTEEIHQFSCDKTKSDDSAVIGGQARRPSYIIIE